MPISEQVLNLLQKMFPAGAILHEPVFSGKEWEYVKECIDTGWVSSAGKYVDRLEEKLVEYTGAKHAIAVINGTAALHICLKLAGVETNDEVLTPALSFVATANAITYCDAVPHFVDSSTKTLGLCPKKLSDYLKEVIEIKSDGFSWNKNTGRRIKACLPMHTYGHPVDMDPLLELCEQYNIDLVEDAAESLGSFYKEKHTGNFGKVSALSFNGNKIMTTGGGGAILTNDESIAKLAKHITTTAKAPHKWEFYHDQMGYNYRLPNLNAALGCAQMEQLPHFLKKKRGLAEKYQKTFNGIDGAKIFKEPDFAHSNYWLNVLILDESSASQRDELLEITNMHGIMTRPAWILMNKLPMFKDCPKMDLNIAESLEKRLINLPSSANIKC